MNGRRDGSASTRVAATAAALVMVAAPPAAADWHTLYFSFNNQRPNSEIVTAYITNQGRFTEIPNGATREITSPFETEGYKHSTGYYDVRVTKQNQQTNVYCSYQAVASYQGTSGWRCSVTRNTMENGATTCIGKNSTYWNSSQPCAFDFDTK